MEPDELDYGHYCIHGTNIGTPGGTDYLCGLCESGFDTPVSVATYEVGVGVSDQRLWPPSTKPHFSRDDALADLSKGAAWCDELNARHIEGAYLLACFHKRETTVWACEHCTLGRPCSYHRNLGYDASVEAVRLEYETI